MVLRLVIEHYRSAVTGSLKGNHARTEDRKYLRCQCATAPEASLLYQSTRQMQKLSRRTSSPRICRIRLV